MVLFSVTHQDILYVFFWDLTVIFNPPPQIIMAILVSWLICFIFTVTNVFPPEKDKYGYYARTDARQGILAAAPWFKIPYPCELPLFMLFNLAPS